MREKSFEFATPEIICSKKAKAVRLRCSTPKQTRIPRRTENPRAAAVAVAAAAGGESRAA